MFMLLLSLALLFAFFTLAGASTGGYTGCLTITDSWRWKPRRVVWEGGGLLTWGCWTLLFFQPILEEQLIEMDNARHADRALGFEEGFEEGLAYRDPARRLGIPPAPFTSPVFLYSDLHDELIEEEEDGLPF